MNVTLSRRATRLDPAPLTDLHLAPPPQEGLIHLSPGPDPFEAKLPPPDAGPAARADLRFFAGQPDEKDPTRFTIRCEHAGRLGDIDMWVQDDRTIYFVERTFAGRP